MCDQQIKHRLGKVGNAVFVKHFELFKSYADENKKTTRADCIGCLVDHYDKTEGGAGRCCSNAKLIFDAKGECRVLEIIASKSPSTRLPESVIKQANVLLQKCQNR